MASANYIIDLSDQLFKILTCIGYQCHQLPLDQEIQNIRFVRIEIKSNNNNIMSTSATVIQVGSQIQYMVSIAEKSDKFGTILSKNCPYDKISGVLEDLEKSNVLFGLNVKRVR